MRSLVLIASIVLLAYVSGASAAPKQRKAPAELANLAEAEELIKNLSTAVNICKMTAVADESKVRSIEMQQTLEYLKATGATSVPYNKKMEFYVNAEQQLNQDGRELNKCKADFKYKYLSNPKEILITFGRRNLDNGKRLLVLWEAALDSIGTKEAESAETGFSTQAKTLIMDLKIQ